MTDRAASRADGDPRAAERTELEAERDYLLGSLRDLDRERENGELTEEDFAALRDSYTARAASVLRRLEDVKAAGSTVTAAPDAMAAPDATSTTGVADTTATPDPPVTAMPAGAVPSTGLRQRLGRRRSVVILVGLVVLGVGIGLLAAGATSTRQSGQGVSGSVHLAPAQELLAAQTAMTTGDDVTALKLFQAVLRVEPDQPEALAYAGWLLREAGDAQENVTLVTQGIVAEENAVADDPLYPDARYFLGVMLLDEAHDPAGAVTQLEAYLALKPSARDAAAVRPILDRARAEAAASSTTRPSTTTPSTTADTTAG